MKLVDQHFSNALYLNVRQVWRYISNYEGSNFPTGELKQLETLVQDIESLYRKLTREMAPQKDAVRKEMIMKSQHFLSSSREMCRSIWAQFDTNLIWIGLIVFAMALIVNYVTMNDIQIDFSFVTLAAACSFIAIIFQVCGGIEQLFDLF